MVNHPNRSKKHEDKEAARRLVEQDIRNAAPEFRKIAPTEFFTYDELPDISPEDRPVIFLTIGTRDELTKRAADAAGKAFREARSRHPQAPILLSFLGYDEDPRELWEFPEVGRYVRRFARAAGLTDPSIAEQVPWVHPGWGISLLAACEVFGKLSPEQRAALPRASKQ